MLRIFFARLQVLSAFGDVALAIGDKFEAYLSHCLTMLASAQVGVHLAETSEH